MSMNDYFEAKRIVINSNNGTFVGPREESLIQKAEIVLNIKFPPTYRQFLLDFGCGDIFGNEIYGIIKDNFVQSTVPNGIWLTLDERETSHLPINLIIIAQGYDGYLALDKNQQYENGEYPIVEWIAGKPNNSDEIIYDDFGCFFLEKIKQ